MVYSIGFIMPSENIFIPQTIFSIQGMPVMFGILKSGELKKGMIVTVDKKTLKIIKVEQGSTNVGISLSDLNVTQAQSLVNKELQFFDIK